MKNSSRDRFLIINGTEAHIRDYDKAHHVTSRGTLSQTACSVVLGLAHANA
jgi:hypothetical protein